MIRMACLLCLLCSVNDVILLFVNGIQAQPVSEDLVEKLLGSGVSVSPVVTIEPRHRKFHQPISITIPLPAKSSLRGGKTRPAAGTPTLRLLCSMTGQSLMLSLVSRFLAFWCLVFYQLL